MSVSLTDRAASLTPRERQILQLIADGNTTADIAFRLLISKNTVLTQRHNIMLKIGTDRMTHAVAIAMREGVIR